MENRVENPGLNIDRGRVDSFKKVIKEKEVFKLEGSDRDLAAIGVIGELGINGVNTTEDLFNKTQNGNVNQEVARKNIKDLGTAIAESILESDNEKLKAAMVAGSYSTEALLPEPWRGRMESDAGDVGLAGVICDALTEKISDKAKKETVQRAMETVDFFKNNSEYNNLLPDQLDASITELRGIINPLNRNEMKVISERLKYLQDEKEKIVGENQKNIVVEKSVSRDEDEDENNGRPERIDFENHAEVLHKCRELLNYLENMNTYSGDLSISNRTTNILENIVNVRLVGKEGFEDIREEVNARLALHDTAYFMEKAGGSLSDKSSDSIPRALSEIGKNGGYLTREVMKFFFEDKGDLGFCKAWDLLQEANFNYKEMLLKAGVDPTKKFEKPLVKDAYFGEKYTNYQYDLKEEDKAEVDKYMLKELGGGERARKALQLAQKMFVASDEASVVNNGFVGGDDFAEAIQFGRYREDDAKPGKTKNAGPDVHRGWIKSLTPGWLRNFSGMTDPDQPIKSETIRKNWDALEAKKDWLTYHNVFVCKKMAPLKELFLDKSLKKPEEVVDIDFFRSKIDLFNKLDPDDKKGWRALWVAGLLQTNMMNPNNVWDSDHISRLKWVLTKESLTLPGQKKEYFLTPEQWKWMEKTLNLKKYFVIDAISDIIGDMYKIKKKR